MNLAPFNTFFTPTADMSLSDIQSEIERLYQRQKAIDACLHNELDEETLFDLLEAYGVDPVEWAETSADNIEFLLGTKF